MPKKKVFGCFLSLLFYLDCSFFWFGLVFWGALFPRMADPIFHESLSLHPPTAGLCPKTLHLDLVIPLPQGDSIQVLPAAVSFWKRERYRLSYRGRADCSFFVPYFAKSRNKFLFFIPPPWSSCSPPEEVFIFNK